MIWHTDLKANLNPKKKNSLLTEDDKNQGQPKKFKDLMRSYWQQYCEKSTIHGVRYIYDPTLRSIERLIWSALVITCVALTCMAYLMLAERYSAQKLQTVVENSQYPVFHIPFPAVGICSNNRINWQKFEEAKAEFLPSTADKTVIDVFTNFVERMETLRFGSFEAFKDMDDMNLEALDGIDVTNLARFMALRCEDIIVNGTCIWRKAEFNCCTLFVLERTEYGYCLVFNSELSAQSLLLVETFGAKYYPFHNSKAGQITGLNFQLKVDAKMKRPNSNVDDTITETFGAKYYPFHNSKAGQITGLNFQLKVDAKMKRPNSNVDDTITILIKRPDQMSNTGYTITPSTETYFIVRPEVTDSDEDIHSISPLKRNCYFQDEYSTLGLKTTMKKEWILNNCLNICHETNVRQYCNCTLPSFFLHTDNTVEQCRPSSFRCLAKNNDIFSYDKRKEEDAYFSSAKPGMTCSCLIPCNTIEYYTSLTTLPLNEEEVANDTSVKLFKVDVHYQSEVVIQYRTSLEFTSIDLIANFGGIFGLCLGASLVSAVELLYYLTFGFGLYLSDNDYFTVLRQNIKNMRLRWAKGVRNSFVDNSEFENTLQRNSSFLVKHPHRKENYW